MHLALPSSSTLASALLRSDDPLEPRLGDTLLFHHDVDAKVPRILVASSFSKAVYYTLFTSDRDSRTSIVRGLANAPKKKTTLATVSIAQKHRLTTVTSGTPRMGSIVTALFSQETLVEKQDEKRLSSPSDEKPAAGLSTELTEKGGADSAEDVPAWAASNRSLSSYLSDDRETLMITYGDGAPEYLRRCMKMEKQRVTLITSEKTYELVPTQATTLAIYAVDTATGRRNQVVWSRTMGVQAKGEQLRVVFPASLTFYPEVRGFLDAVIVALVAWQMKMHMEL
ncbi:hypothetical protein FKP32DRAFT_1599884 [Trametes sanguinea]|nr:hypothetical protein FKP32DRAFT_1599884 [Trametes sanguinea]